MKNEFFSIPRDILGMVHSLSWRLACPAEFGKSFSDFHVLDASIISNTVAWALGYFSVCFSIKCLNLHMWVLWAVGQDRSLVLYKNLDEVCTGFMDCLSPVCSLLLRFGELSY